MVDDIETVDPENKFDDLTSIEYETLGASVVDFVRSVPDPESDNEDPSLQVKANTDKNGHEIWERGIAILPDTGDSDVKVIVDVHGKPVVPGPWRYNLVQYEGCFNTVIRVRK